MLAEYLGGVFYGLQNRETFKRAYAEILASGPPTGRFTGDNMILFGRSMGFLEDQKLMPAFKAADPGRQEVSLIWRIHTLHWAAERALHLEGDFVEAACYKGFTARVLCDALDFSQVDKTYWLYDMFEVGGEFALGEHTPELHGQVIQRFADVQNVRVVKGRIPEVLASEAPEKIAFMHVDMNNAKAEIGLLDALFDRVVSGGVVVLDDYGWLTYAAQKTAEDAWFADRGLRVLELPTGQGLVFKL
jgi:O-methyltransferase